MPINYGEGKIYKLVNNSSSDCYYGSTCDELHKRKYGHKNDYKKYLNGNGRYVTSFKIIDPNIDDVEIVLVEEISCNNKQALHARERWYIEHHDCVNKVIPGRTRKEYEEATKENIRHREKHYREVNKDKIRQKKKEYGEANKEHIRQKKKESDTKYREVNKDKIRQREKEYRERKKTQLLDFFNDTSSIPFA